MYFGQEVSVLRVNLPLDVKWVPGHCLTHEFARESVENAVCSGCLNGRECNDDLGQSD